MKAAIYARVSTLFGFRTFLAKTKSMYILEPNTATHREPDLSAYLTIGFFEKASNLLFLV